MHTDHLPTPICPYCCNPVTEHAYECIGIEARKRQDITEGVSYLLEARGILDALQEPAETKSDPETERIVAEALDSFWYHQAANNTVENPTVAPFGWEPAPQWAKDAKDQDSR